MPQSDSTKILLKQIADLQNQLNSLGIEVSHQKVAKDFFSDIIQSQMAWFGIIFAVAFGVIGLVYWRGIRNSIKKLSDDFNAEKSRVAQQVLSLENKITSANTENAEMVRKENEKLKEVVAKYNDEKIQAFNQVFKTEKVDLLRQMKQIEFNACRGMFFSANNLKEHLGSLSWLVTMLHLLIIDKVRGSKDDWIKNLEGISPLVSPKTPKETESLKTMLKTLEDLATREKDLGYKNRILDCVNEVTERLKL